MTVSIAQYRLKDLAEIPGGNPRIRYQIERLVYCEGESDTPLGRRLLAERGLTQEGRDFLPVGGRIYPCRALSQIERYKEMHPEYFE